MIQKLLILAVALSFVGCDSFLGSAAELHAILGRQTAAMDRQTEASRHLCFAQCLSLEANCENVPNQKRCKDLSVSCQKNCSGMAW